MLIAYHVSSDDARVLPMVFATRIQKGIDLEVD